MASKDDEAQPKRTRRQRLTYPKRVELRMTDEGYALAESSAAQATEKSGRKVTVSDVIREAVEDGCRRLVARLEKPAKPAPAGLSPAQLDSLVDALQGVRDEVRRIGHNVNQMARVANADGTLPDDLADVKQRLAVIDGHVLTIGVRVLGFDDADEAGLEGEG